MAIPGINDVPNISGLKASPGEIGRMPQDDQQSIMRAMQQKAGGQPTPQPQAMPGGGAPAPAPTGDPQMPPQATTAELSGAAKMAQGVMSGREQQGNDLMAAHPSPKVPTEEDMRITPNQAQAFLPLLMGLVSLAGNRSSPAMMSSMQSMNAMMETQMEGNNSITKHHEEQMWKQFDAATAAHKEEMTILMPKFKALQSGSPESLEEARMALHEAGIKSSTIDQLFNGDATKNLQSWIIAKEKLDATVAYQGEMLKQKGEEGQLNRDSRERTAQVRQSLSSAGISPEEIAFRVQRFTDTGDMGEAYKGLSARQIGARSQVSEGIAEGGVSSSDAVVRKATLKANQTALNQLTTREASVKQITGMLPPIFAKAKELATKINTSFLGQYGNQTLNDLSSKFGDNHDLQQLRVIANTGSREYKRATTAPGSNAQMHAGHAEDAEKMLNGDMPLNKMMGAIDAMELDISAVDKSLSDQKKALTDEIGRKQGGGGHFTGKMDAGRWAQMKSGDTFTDEQGNTRQKP